MARIALAACFILLVGLAQEELAGAQDAARLQSGVVKITAKPPQGSPNVGTGFIVRLESNAAYIVTAAHIVAGDERPKVEFFTKRNMPVTAEVLGLEGNDEVSGLALVVVRGPENLPKGITALSLAATTRLSGGEDILVIGFPRNAGPWALIKGNISSRQGRAIYFSPSVDSGHSGGPVFHSNNVVAVVGAGDPVGRGVTARSVQDYIEGFGIMSHERTSAASMVTESSPPPDATAKSEPRPMIQDREVTGKDGAPMVLIPAGEFWMGSPDGEGENDEHPRHLVYLDAFYMDKFEVTVARYAEFVRSTKRSKPLIWDTVDINKHGNLPVIGVYWHDAEAYCRGAGKGLPTEAEWEKAARGTDGRTYPWGNEPPTPRLANFGKVVTIENTYDIVLVPVDSYEAGKSPYGLHHMVGNVWEWTADWYDEQYYKNSPRKNPQGPSKGDYRVIRGGSWNHGPGYVRSAGRYRSTPTHGLDSIGFRCAQDSSK